MKPTREEQTASGGGPLRVLLFSHETTLSGAPVQLLHLAKWLHQLGCDVVVAAPEPGPIARGLREADIKVVLDSNFLLEPDKSTLRRLCRKFEVIVANTIAAFPVVDAAHREKVPVVWYLHETLFAIELMAKIAEIRPALGLATRLVTPTATTAAIYQPLTRTPIEVIPYGIPDLGARAPRTRSDATRFLCLGTYEPRKGQDVLTRAIQLLDDQTRARTYFTFAGRPLFPDFFAALTREAAELPNVKLFADTAHQQARALIAENDVLVCASRDETMPITIIEAMSLGRAVISTDVGGIAEWMRDGLNGLLVPKEDPTALAQAITSLSSNPARRVALATTSRRTFERHFQIEAFAARFVKVLESAASERQPERPRALEKYDDWVREFDTFTASDRTALQRRMRMLPRQPLISILLPVFNPEIEFLRGAIDSVKRQIYERWELCIADDASTDPEVRKLIEAATRDDARIKVIFRERNGHISACSNSALEMATGDWCALLDHDDALAEHALALVACEIKDHPDAGLIYSDEDKIDAAGARSNPFFKTDWNRELFLGQNYINHLGVYRSDVLRQIGGFREGFDGSQDYDLALRCIDRLRPEQVRHIPRILYHWRMVTGSLAAVPDAKPYAKEAARRAIADHCKRCDMPGTVVPCPENTESHRVIHALPEPAPLASIIIPTRDHADLLERCVESIRERSDYGPLEIIIVDNGSVEANSRELLSRFESDKAAHILRDRGAFNYSRLNNLAAAQARGEILLFLNNDTEVDDRGWLTEMVSHAARAEVGAVGARLWYPDGTLQHGGVVLGFGGLAGHAFPRIPRGHPGYFNRAFLQQNCSAVTGACMAVRKQVFQEFDGFNEQHLGVNFSDIDFCLRLRANGYEVIWTPYANLLHHESASRGHRRTEEQQTQFLREASYMREVWGAELMNDPFYNPNLSLNLLGFEIAFPPRLPEFANEEAAAVCAR